MFVTFDDSSRPSAKHVKAIVFKEDESTPQFTWLACQWIADDDGGWYQSAETFEALGEDGRETAQIRFNPVLKKALDNTIVLCWRDGFLFDGSKRNQCIKDLLANKLGEHHDWRGRLVAYGTVGLGIDQCECRDLTMADFRHISDFVLVYNSSPALEVFPPRTPAAAIAAVRINCLGAQKVLEKSKFESVEISSFDPIFFGHDTSGIAARVDLPVFTRRLPQESSWANADVLGGSPTQNVEATFLHLCIDPGVPDTLHRAWAWAPMSWQNDVGNVLVVRQDKKPLLPVHVETLANYCRFEVLPYLAHSIGEYGTSKSEEPMTRDAVLAMIHRPAFNIYWHKSIDAKVESAKNSANEATDSEDVGPRVIALLNPAVTVRHVNP